MNTRTVYQRGSTTLGTTSSAELGAGHPQEVRAVVQPWKCRSRAVSYLSDIARDLLIGASRTMA
jgi:hypothetical protein